MLKAHEQMLDVTLVSEEGVSVQAHKIVLSAGSNFFEDIFMNNQQSNVLLFLKGVLAQEIECILDLFYDGVTVVRQESLEKFLELSKTLKIKGIHNVSSDMEEENDENQPTQTSNTYFVEAKIIPNVESLEKENVVDEYQFKNAVDLEGAVKLNEDHYTKDIIFEEGHQTKSLQKTSSNQRMRLRKPNNSRTHLRLSMTCEYCGKSLFTQKNLEKHIESLHKNDFYNCKDCGKGDMSKMAFKIHAKNFHSGTNYSCDICGKEKMQYRIYVKHMSQNHG